MLISYVRDNKRRPIATVVALDRTHIGAAICNSSDRFSKQRGREIAAARASRNIWPEVFDAETTKLLNVAMMDMEKRAAKYYKDN